MLRHTPHLALCTFLLVLPAACGDGGSSSASTGGSGGEGAGGTTSTGGAGGGTTATGGDAPLDPGAAAAGWERAFAPDAVGIACGMTRDEMVATGAPSLAFGEAVMVVGVEQVSGNNQDPVVARFDGASLTFCQHHESGGPDGRAYGLTWNGGGVAYVVYTVDGGGSGIEATAGSGWLSSYGNGGGPKVSFLGRVDAGKGDLLQGTFIIAKLETGKTNTHRPAAAPTKLAAGGIEFLGESAFQAMNPDGTTMDCTDYPFSTRYRFTDDLTTLTCSSSTNCTSAVPCE